MKIKWIVITKSTEDKKFHCFDEVYETKELALAAMQNSKNGRMSYLHNWKKAKIFPINWGSLKNRSPKE